MGPDHELNISAPPRVVQFFVSCFRGSIATAVILAFFNLTPYIEYCSIYMRPSFTRVRKAYPEMSAWWAFKLCVVETDLPTLQQTQDLYSAAGDKKNSGRDAVSGRSMASKSSKSLEVLKSIDEESDDDEDDRTGGLFGKKKLVVALNSSGGSRVAMDGTVMQNRDSSHE